MQKETDPRDRDEGVWSDSCTSIYRFLVYFQKRDISPNNNIENSVYGMETKKELILQDLFSLRFSYHCVNRFIVII